MNTVNKANGPIFKVIIYDSKGNPVRKSRNLRGIREYAAKFGVVSATTREEDGGRASIHILFGNNAKVSTMFNSPSLAKEYCEHRLRKNGVTQMGLRVTRPLSNRQRKIVQGLAKILGDEIEAEMGKAIRGEPLSDKPTEAL